VVTEAIAAVKRDVKVPAGNYLVWVGEFENQQRALARLAVIVPFSFLVVFVLLVMALGSARSALSVLMVAPFAMSGGVFGLQAAHIPLSVSAAVGFIALLGQVCLASLLVVSAIDQRRRQGEDLLPALIGGAASRFRTVLMTALLAMLGLMPAALSAGVGSETQRPFAVVIVSGLMTAVAVTLIVLPFVYCLIAGKRPETASEADAGDGETR
jgi:cobalt-zinc-cadmium resistance protein CzcA